MSSEQATRALPVGEVRVVDDVAVTFAEIFGDAYRERRHDRFSVALSGGPTARRAYGHLGPGIDWQLVDFYWGDERCVPLDDPDSNYLLAREALLDRVGQLGSVHPLTCDDPLRYAALLDALRALDLIHLGVGPDGHTASLFPGSPSLEADELVVRSSDPAAANPHERVTLTLPAISRAELVVFTVAGEEKRDAMARIRAGEDLPAARVRASRVIWVVDAAAWGTQSWGTQSWGAQSRGTQSWGAQ